MNSSDTLPEYRPLWPETAVIWGAGASAALGLPGTTDIGCIISCLAGVGLSKEDEDLKGADLDTRMEAAFNGYPLHPELKAALRDLLLLLYDGDDSESNYDSQKLLERTVKHLADKYALDAGLDAEETEELAWELRRMHEVYDWAGVRSILKHLSRTWNLDKGKPTTVDLTELLTTVDQLYNSDMAIPTEEMFLREGEKPSDWIYLISKGRLLGVQRCLRHLISTITRVLIQAEPGQMDRNKLAPYWTIAQDLAELMLQESQEYAWQGYQTDWRKFYLFSYAIISYNWDPIMLWLIFNAHKEVNDRREMLDKSLLRLFNDCGDGIGVRHVPDGKEVGDTELFNFMMNESIARRINDPKYQDDKKSRLIRLGKLLYPHAGVGWRACPRCGKMFTDLGPSWDDLYSTLPFGPDLLPELQPEHKPRTKKERRERRYGLFGALQCVFCGSTTQPFDSPLFLQSALKPQRHHVLEGIFRELGLVVGNARHLVFAGYSLPPDDYLYRCFYQSSWAANNKRQDKAFCSLVNFDSDYVEKMGARPWLRDQEIVEYLNTPNEKNDETKQTVQRILNLFGLDRVRVSLLGIPNIITNHPRKGSKEALKDLLYPNDCFPEGFPPKRD